MSHLLARRVPAATLAASALTTLLLLGPLPARAHDGEDHSAPPTQPLPAAVAPRTSAQTEQFELVAVFSPQPPRLTVYLDELASNQPVAGAVLELESGAFKATAQALAPGVYQFNTPPLAQAGSHPLTFSVSTAQASDLLDASLTLPATEAGPSTTTPTAATATPTALAGWWAALSHPATLLLACAAGLLGGWVGRRGFAAPASASMVAPTPASLPTPAPEPTEPRP